MKRGYHVFKDPDNIEMSSKISLVVSYILFVIKYYLLPSLPYTVAK